MRSRFRTAQAGLRSLAAAGVWALVLATRASAQVQTNQFVDLAKSPPPEFSPAPLLYGAYAFVWAAVVAYTFTLWRRMGRVDRELQDVRARLATKR